MAPSQLLRCILDVILLCPTLSLALQCRPHQTLPTGLSVSHVEQYRLTNPACSLLRTGHSWGQRRSSHLFLARETFPDQLSEDDALNLLPPLPTDGLPDATLVAVVASGGIGLSFALFKTIVYWRMQYIIAALLSRRVPKVPYGADILELSARDAKNLYYLPTGGVRRVIMSSLDTLKEPIAQQAATQAGIPTVAIRPQKDNVIACPDNIVDCVVSIYGFEKGNAKLLIQEATRVLKPGGCLIAVEKGEAPLLAQEIGQRVGTAEVDLVRNIWDPYTIVVATKAGVLEAVKNPEARSAAVAGGGLGALTTKTGSKAPRKAKRS